jgi:hypothetical protein
MLLALEKPGKINFMRKSLCPEGYLLCSKKNKNMKPNSGGMNIWRPGPNSLLACGATWLASPRDKHFKLS